ncbi:ferric reductase NAD binding domain-containing protein [Tricladium varicosporioides]|nr:ferric reductase NAD binding domain-containing protein [Hymenoscyphus varicosporioides]
MAWPYHLVDLNEAQKHQRRILLDQYGVFAQLSALVPVIGFLLYRFGKWVGKERKRAGVKYDTVPSSPRAKHARLASAGGVVKNVRAGTWWLNGEIREGWGERKFWIIGVVWMGWLLFLCTHKTGDDYLHITKRFGVIAASQLPFHYMLSMKSLYSPLGLIFKASHEKLNPWHRLSGRIIYSMLCLHVTWYLNFFVQANVLAKRLSAPVVIIGILAFISLTILVSSSLAIVRRWSYRVFFVTHLIIGISVLPLLFFHAPALRIYIFEALAIFIFDVVCRKLDTVTGFATITPIPHSKLVKLKIPVPASKLKRFHAAPGQHVYLSIPPESTPKSTSAPSIHDLLFNPFTVAEISSKDVTLVLRTLDGPTTRAIQNLSKLPKAKPPINIEGPLGSSKHFPSLAVNYDRILFVAGGVGATFILPIYQHIQEHLENEAKSPDRATFVWSVRSASEASWAVDPKSRLRLDDDENLKIFITRNSSDPNSNIQDAIELDEIDKSEDEVVKATGGRGRPDLKKIVDEVFRCGNEERVAVLVCGPVSMAREVRRYVGYWVTERGRDVWWHDEGFGW